MKFLSRSLVSGLFESRLIIESHTDPLIVSAATPPRGSRVEFSLCSGTCPEVSMWSRPCRLTLCFSCFHPSDPGWDRGARDQNLSATWRRLWRGWGVQGADQSPEGERGTHSWGQLLQNYVSFYVCWSSDRYHSLPVHPCFPSPQPRLSDTFIFHISFLSLCFSVVIHRPLSSFPRRASLLLWLAPTSWLRWRGRRSVVVFTPGELLKWRTLNTMTSSSYVQCLCESPC